MIDIRVRIPPSPTGSPHIGNARTALFNYAFAKHYGGTFIVRIEDTDIERSERKYEHEILEGFRWLGIDADESPEVGGPYAPYRQSERNHIYRPYLDRLLQEGIAFYCFHTKNELDSERSRLITEKKSPLHRCKYRDIGLEKAKTLMETKPESIIRFKVPLNRTIQFRDLIRGELRFETDLIEDFSLARKPDEPLYNFAVTIDDALMKISHVIRGEEHTTNTPKQILLAEALGFPIPEFAHLPLILGTDRSKLSKRHGAMSVLEYRQLGYLPETLFNFIALLGWHPKDDHEIMSKEEIVREFSLEKVQKSGAIFDFQKLDWMNGKYIREKALEDLVQLCTPFISDFLQMPLPNNQYTQKYMGKVIALEQSRLKKLSEIGELTDYFFRTPKYDKMLLRWKTMSSDKEVFDSLDRSEKIISELPEDQLGKINAYLLEKKEVSDIGKILWPLRVALTGKKASPGPSEVMEILGKEKSLKRVRAAKELIRS